MKRMLYSLKYVRQINSDKTMSMEKESTRVLAKDERYLRR